MTTIADKSIDSEGHKICVYGPPGGGKTMLIGELALHFKVLLLDLDNGWKTLKQLPIEAQRNITYVRIPDDRETYNGITTLLKLTDGKPVKVCDRHGQVVVGRCPKCLAAGLEAEIIDINIEAMGPDWIIALDSMTQATTSAMGKSFKGQTLENFKPEYDNYTMQGIYMDRLLTSIQNSRAHWVVTSHESEVELEDGSIKVVPVAGTRNFSRSSARYFDHVVYATTKNFRHTVTSSSTASNTINAKSRTDVDLSNSLTGQLVDLIRSQKGTAKNKEAAAKLANKPAGNLTRLEKEEGVGKASETGTEEMTAAEKIAALRAAKK